MALRISGLILTPIALPLIVVGSASAQIVASELATVTQTIAGTDLEVVYSRPSLRGRALIFGGIHPIGEAWTGGANEATELRLSKDVTIGGVPVPAGGYSVWFDVQEGHEWRAMLHEDTTMYHGPHPPIDEEQIIVPVSREKGEDMVETLEWGFEDLGWNDATVTLAWGQERLRMHVEVDAGITLEVPEDEAARYVGEWRIDDSGDRPDPQEIGEALGTPDLGDTARRYYEAMRDTPTERTVEIVHDPDTGWLFRTDPEFAPLFATFMGLDGTDPRFEILVPRGEGFFVLTRGVGGQLMGFYPEFSPIAEFVFDDQGRAVSFEVRDPEDAVVMTGARVGG